MTDTGTTLGIIFGLLSLLIIGEILIYFFLFPRNTKGNQQMVPGNTVQGNQQMVPGNTVQGNQQMVQPEQNFNTGMMTNPSSQNNLQFQQQPGGYNDNVLTDQNNQTMQNYYSRTTLESLR